LELAKFTTFFESLRVKISPPGRSAHASG
jgi:hypothetical protein